MSRLAERANVNARSLEVAWESRLEDHVIDIAYSPDGRWLAAAAVSGSIELFKAESGEQKALLPGHRNGTFSLSWRSDSQRLASGGQDGMVRVWDISEGTAPLSIEAGAEWVERVAYSHAGDYLVSAAGRKLRLWNSQGERLQTYGDHPSTISDVQWQPGDLLFTTACYGQVATFRRESTEAVKKFEWKGSILCLRWSPDSNYIATGNQDASVHFWYRKTGRDLEMSGYAQKVRALAWDKNSRFLATGGSPTVIVWDCSGKGPAGTRPIQLQGHSQAVSALAFQHTGSFLASGGRDGRVCLWSPKKGDYLMRMSALDGEITNVRWSPSDRGLASASANGQLRVFQPAA
jgi:WD40 repeat protein